MKTMNRIQSYVLAGLLLAGANASAAGYKLADKVGKGIAECRDEVVDVKKAVDTAMAALDKIVAQAAVDPRKAFKEFDKSVPKIESAAAKARKRAEEMREKGKEYFTVWEKELAEVNDPKIRELAQQRKEKLQSTFDNIKTHLTPAKEQFNTWLTNCKDLQKYLNQDLTIAGIDAAKDLFAKTKTDGMALQQTLDKVITELNSVVAAITPSKVEKK
jgi:flagellar biosynthesis chaperone FliJ